MIGFRPVLSAKGDKLTITPPGTLSVKRKEAHRYGHGSLRSGSLKVKRGATGRTNPGWSWPSRKASTRGSFREGYR